MHSTILRLYCCLFCLGASAFSAFTQSFSCGADPMRERVFQENPALRLQHEQLEQLRYETMKKQPAFSSADAMYTIPVVVHIIHQNGAENISDAWVQAGIDLLNAAYANTGYYDQGNGVATPVRFCLARQTPAGLVTTGIDRVLSPLTDMTMETQDLAVKNLGRWDPAHYLNIWLVREIVSAGSGPGVAGYAYFPSAHGTDIDGIVVEARFFGNNAADNCVLTHEAGHYLGLYHTFEGGCTNGDCAKDGDRVCDTPPDQSTAWLPCGAPANTCSTDAQSGFTSDQPDMTINYMDYATISCYNAFTAGQRDRMEFFITGARASLLESKACLDPCTTAVSAAFAASAGPKVSAGSTVTFTASDPGAATYAWEINGTPAGTLNSMTNTFNAIGQYIVALHVTGADPNCFETWRDTLTVVCGVHAGLTVSPVEPKIGETVTLTSTTTGAGQIQWTINGVNEGSAPVLTKIFNEASSYSVCLTASDSFCQDVACMAFEVADTNQCVESYFKSVNYFAGSSDFYWANDLLRLPGGQLLAVGHYEYAVNFNRFSPSGNLLSLWRMFPTSYPADQITDASLTTDGYVLLTQSSYSANYLTNNLRIAKLDVNTRQYAWYKSLTHPSRNVHVYQITENPVTKRYQVLGHAAQPDIKTLTDEAVILDIDPASGDVLAQKNYSMNEVPLARSGIWVNNQYYTAGGNFKKKPMFALYDAYGSVLWSREYNFSAPPDTFSVLRSWANIRHDNGNLVAVGAGGRYVYFIKTDLDGNPLATRVFHGEPGSGLVLGSQSDAVNLEVLSDGYLLSYIFVSSSNEHHLALVKLNKNGDILWRKSRVHTKLMGSKFVVQDGHAYAWTGQLLQTGNTGFLLKTPLRPASDGDCVKDTFALDSYTPQVSDSVYHPAPIVSPPILTLPEPFTSQLRGYAANTLCSNVFCPEICNNNLDDDNDGLTDCADTEDCPCAHADCAVPFTPKPPLIAGREEWKSPQSEIHATCQPLVANLNPQQDNIPEIIVTTYDTDDTKPRHIRMYAGDGSNAANPAQLTMTGGWISGPDNVLAVGDLDGNGVPELIVPFYNNTVRVYSNYNPQNNPVMSLLMTGSNLQSNQVHIGLADFDGDGRSEIYSGHQVYWIDYSVPGLNKLVSVVPANSPQNHFTSYAADLLSVADCNGDPDCEGLELVTGNTIYSVDLKSTAEDGDPRAIIPRRTVDAVTGGMALPDGPAVVADVDLDGVPDVITRAQPLGLIRTYLYVWNAKKFIKQISYPAFGYLGAAGVSSVANVFDDTKMGAAQDLPEIFFSSSFRLYCLNLNAAGKDPANPFWWAVDVNDPANFSNPVSTFDFDGNGQPEVVFRYQDSLKVLYGGPAPFPAGVRPDRTWFSLVGRSGTTDEYPAIADVDNDGQAEIVFAGADGGTSNSQYSYARLRVVGADLTKGAPWKPTRRLWNQFSYAPNLVDDDLRMPKNPQKSHLEMPAGSGYRPLNIVLGQKPVPAFYNGYVYLPNATLALEQARCAGNDLEIRLRVCNRGSEVLPAATPLRFYLGDPTQSAATRLADTAALAKDLDPDSCALLVVLLPKPYLGKKIFAVLNDDGMHATPFKLPADFPLTAIAECDYTDNFANFELPPIPSSPQLGPDIAVCQNGVWTFSAGPGFQSYRWSNLSTDSSITVFEPGTYWVEATDHCGQAYRDTVVVAVNPAGVVDLGPDRKICGDSAIQLQATPGFAEYAWFPADGLSCTDCPNPTAQSAQRRTYTVQAKSPLGCFSFDTVSIEVNLVQHTVASVSICPGDSALVFGNYEKTAGSYAKTFQSANGCDSTHRVDVAVLPVFETAEQRQLCAGDSLLVFGNYEKTAGLYAKTFQALNGCDSTHRVDLAVLPVFQTAEQRQLCAGDSLLIFGNYEKTGGLYAKIFQAQNGCDSTHRVDLTVLPVFETAEQRQLCAGDSLLIFGNYEKMGGLYAKTFQAQNGCDSTHRVDLAVLPVYQTAEQRQLCAGDSLLIFGNYEKTAGTYAKTFQSANGCDSTHRVDLAVLPVYQTAEQRQLCSGDSLLIFGNYEKTAGLYAKTFQAVNGCDSTHRVDLTVLPVFQTTEQRQLCAGDSLLVFGNYKKTAGLYAKTFQAINGCDSTHRVDLAVLPVFQTTESRQICPGDSSLIFGKFEKAAGLYTKTFLALNGCDSTHRVELTVQPAIQTAEARQLCTGDSTLVFGVYQKQAGAYTMTFQAQGGCDSVQTIKLIVLPNLQVDEARQICTGDSSLIFGKYEHATGVYRQTFQSAAGCDSTHSVTLNVLPEFHTTESRQLCPGDSVLIFGKYERDAGMYTQTVQAVGGCDSVITIALELILLPAFSFSTIPSCPDTATGVLDIATTAGTGLEFSLDDAPFDTVRTYAGLPAGSHNLRLREPSGCLSEQTFQLAEAPPVAVQLPGDTLLQPGQSIELFAGTTGTGLQYAWSPATGLNCASCPVVVARPESATEYTLTVIDGFGCTASDHIRIDVRPATAIFLPGAFKPAGSGANRFFTVYTGSGVINVQRLEVYDRWGGLMFHREHFEPGVEWLGWDGTWRGQEAAPGVYVFLVEVVLIDGSVVRKTGDVTLLR